MSWMITVNCLSPGSRVVSKVGTTDRLILTPCVTLVTVILIAFPIGRNGRLVRAFENLVGLRGGGFARRGFFLFDGRWQYEWNAENRLIAMRSADIRGHGHRTLELRFTYDHLGRRTTKHVLETTDGRRHLVSA